MTVRKVVADHAWQAAADVAVAAFERSRRNEYRRRASLVSERMAEHEAPDAFRFDRYRDGL